VRFEARPESACDMTDHRRSRMFAAGVVRDAASDRHVRSTEREV